MVDPGTICPHMIVTASDGEHVGTVDGVEGDRIKLTRNDSAEGEHHHVPLSAVARVDEQVHLSITKAAALAGATPSSGDADHVAPRKTNHLWWVGAVVLMLLVLLLFKACSGSKRDATVDTTQTTTVTTTSAAPAVEAVTLPNGQKVDVAPATLTYDVQRYLASDGATPRTFVFERLNFDTGAASIRPVDQPTVEALAQILVAYPATRVRLVGYADARGTTPANAALGQQRATAVADGLIARGVARTAIEAASGGEGNPDASNATAPGRAENRRTELVVLAK